MVRCIDIGLIIDRPLIKSLVTTNANSFPILSKEPIPISQDDDCVDDDALKSKDHSDPKGIKSDDLSSDNSFELSDTVIKKSKLNALKFLHRTAFKGFDGKTRHRIPVCLICDCVIKGVEPIKYVNKSFVKKHGENILDIESYETFYDYKMPSWLKKQYEVKGLEGYLLSPRATRNNKREYSCCAYCERDLKKERANPRPPMWAIANGFAIGQLPNEFTYSDSDGSRHTVKIDIEDDVNDVLRAMLSPSRPYGYVFAFTGGQQKSLRGSYACFETNQSRLSSAVQAVKDAGIGPTIYCVACGRFTPSQKTIITTRCEVDTKHFLALFEWFVKESGHPAFKDLEIPSEAPKVVLVNSDDVRNLTDEPVDPAIEDKFEGATYHFSSAQDPSDSHSVYSSPEEFTVNMLKGKDPTLLTYGGNYVKNKELLIENVLPFAFPSGHGGTKLKRRTVLSEKSCIERYGQSSMRQLMRGDCCLFFNHMYGRRLSYDTGLSTLKKWSHGEQLGDFLGRMRSCDVGNDNPIKGDVKEGSEEYKELMKAISTSCRSIACSPEAAKEARKKSFAMMDYYGVNPIFVTITPDDECSFRVRLFCHAGDSVSECEV